MCGIFGYAGSGRSAPEAVLEGLQRLDYRGYDSWGVASLQKDGIAVHKETGIVGKRLPLAKSPIAIGHTRWATHGAVTQKNAHPHYASDRSFVVAHNGIVENADDLRARLSKKYDFVSETDTESIVHLIEEFRQDRPIEEAVRLAFRELTGRNTIIVLTKDGAVIAARNGSPLVAGWSESGDVYFSSDVYSFAPHVDRVLVLENGQMVGYANREFTLMDAASGKKLKPRYEPNVLHDVRVDKGAYAHYMLKEVHEDPYVVRQLTKTADADYRALALAIKRARTVYCIGSGTAGAAAAQIAYYLREYGKVNAVPLIGAEASEYMPLISSKDLLIAPSQSGETADVLEVLEHAKARGAKIASFVNMPGSMMTRLSDFKFMANAGPEICVMSTKIFVSQIAWGYLVAKTVSGTLKDGKHELSKLADVMDAYFANRAAMARIRQIAARLAKKEHLYLLGKGQNLQIIKEGMVKIIKGSYVHAHAIPAGDLKHYAITLMEKGVSVIAAVSNDTVKTDVLNAIHEVRARGAEVIGIAPENDARFAAHIPVPDTGETSAIMNTLPFQLLAYHMAAALKHNVDKPRNIAKSVTVK